MWPFCLPHTLPVVLVTPLNAPYPSVNNNGTSVYPILFPLYLWTFCVPCTFPTILMAPCVGSLLFLQDFTILTRAQAKLTQYSSFNIYHLNLFSISTPHQDGGRIFNRLICQQQQSSGYNQRRHFCHTHQLGTKLNPSDQKSKQLIQFLPFPSPQYFRVYTIF